LGGEARREGRGQGCKKRPFWVKPTALRQKIRSGKKKEKVRSDAQTSDPCVGLWEEPGRGGGSPSGGGKLRRRKKKKTKNKPTPRGIYAGKRVVEAVGAETVPLGAIPNTPPWRKPAGGGRKSKDGGRKKEGLRGGGGLVLKCRNQKRKSIGGEKKGGRKESKKW